MAAEPLDTELPSPPTSPTSPLSPANQEAWHGATKDALKEANSLTRDMLKHLQETESAWNSASRPFSRTLAKGDNRCRQLRLKTGPPARSSQNIAPRAQRGFDSSLLLCRDAKEGLDTKIQRTGDCLRSAEHSLKAKWAALKACEWPLELRAKSSSATIWRRL